MKSDFELNRESGSNMTYARLDKEHIEENKRFVEQIREKLKSEYPDLMKEPQNATKPNN